jgi:hypothetical protein
MVEIMRKECRDKGILAPRVDDFFQPERIEEAARYWERGLAHQVEKLPPFDKVVGELDISLKSLL